MSVNTYFCRCGMPAETQTAAGFVCWWHWIGPEAYWSKFDHEEYKKMKDYQEKINEGTRNGRVGNK